jgi:hypothetical protein
MKGNQYTPNHLILIRPLNFGYNEETSQSNTFQNKVEDAFFNDLSDIDSEFRGVVNTLLYNNISFTVFNEIETPIIKPDAIFSNNWIVYMPDGNNYTMSMLAQNRKAEINKSLIIGEHNNMFENLEGPLEGTGSMVFDHMNRKIYAAISPRTNIYSLECFAKYVNYNLITFNTSHKEGEQVYHTNVLLSIGEKWAVICTDVIDYPFDVIESLVSDGKEIIDIGYSELIEFCANIFEVRDINNDLVVLMSSSAFSTYSSMGKLKYFEQYVKVACTPIHTIEEIGGGSLRCMLTGIFL